MTPEELRELQERVALVVEMTESQGWALFLDAARSMLVIRQNRIIQGKCETQEDYKSEVAFINGIEYLLNLPLRLQESLTHEMFNQAEDAEAELQEEVV